MNRIQVRNLARLAACALFATTPRGAPAQSPNTIEIVFDTGPHAGTHTLPAVDSLCVRTKARRQLSAAYKNMGATDPRTVSALSLVVSDADAEGPRRGSLDVRFGDPDEKRPPTYEIAVPAAGKSTITVTKNGGVTEIAFYGEAKDGVRIRVTARCASIDEL